MLEASLNPPNTIPQVYQTLAGRFKEFQTKNKAAKLGAGGSRPARAHACVLVLRVCVGAV